MEALTAFCAERDLILLEDTCEALGSKFSGRFAGSFGLLGTFSFYFSHHITTVEGGMVVTDDDDIADVLRCMWAHGWNRGPGDTGSVPFDQRYRFVTTGFNFRPNELTAAFGIHQLRKLDSLNQSRKAAVNSLTGLLSDMIDAEKFKLMNVDPRVDAALFCFPVLCRNKGERDRLVDHLESREIETRPIICGNIAHQPAMAQVHHRVSSDLAGADEIMDCGLYWGIHPRFGRPEIAYIADALEAFPWE